MSDKYLKFKFENAKLFPKNEKTKDFVTNLDIPKKGKLILSRSSKTERKKRKINRNS